MTHHDERVERPSGMSAGLKLVALALVLIAIAVAADFTWMLPHPGPVANPERLPTAAASEVTAPAMPSLDDSKPIKSANR